jgi:hypothetical protein
VSVRSLLVELPPELLDEIAEKAAALVLEQLSSTAGQPAV